jgi:hypothetical protein
MVHAWPVGSKGIKPRKRRRPLPKVRSKASVLSDEPPIMWPPPGSGFEASPYSPAGRAQQMWRLVRGLSSGGRRQRRAVRLVTLLVVVVVLGPLVVVAIAAVT